jgi:hypothetical protein
VANRKVVKTAKHAENLDFIKFNIKTINIKWLIFQKLQCCEGMNLI